MMERMSDDAWLEINAPSSAETRVPPLLHAVPAATMGILSPGQLVTVGDPGGWWLLDETIIAGGPFIVDEDEVYELTSLAEWGAITVRPHEQEGVPAGSARLLPWKAPTSSLWIYRPVETEGDLLDLPSRTVLDNLQDDLLTPPSPRRPRPARELPSLSGHRVYGPWGETGWAWGVAISEPVSMGADIVVRVVALSDWARISYGAVDPDRIGTIPLHRLWTY